MRVLHLIGGGDTGGARTHMISLLRGLSASPETEVRLCSFREGEFTDAARAAGIDVKVIHTGNPLFDVKQLLAEIRAGGYDLLHSHGAKGNSFALLMKRLTGLPTLCTVHSDPKLDYLHSRAKQWTLGALNAFAIRRLDFQAPVAGQLSGLLIQRGLDPRRVFTIYNGLDFSDTSPRGDAADVITVGIVARFTPVKDIPLLLRGFAKAYARAPKLRLVIAGDGDSRPALERLAQELGVADVTTFTGWLNDTRLFYRSLDVNVLTSKSEGFPYSLLEGAQERCATVSTAVGGIPELIDDDVNGFLIPPGDEDALADRLVALCEDPQKLRAFGDALYDKASRLFSEEAMREDYLRIYRHVVGWHRAKKRSKPPKVLICGAYGFDNAGDDGILKAITGDIRSLNPYADITVMSRRPKQTRLTHRVQSFFTFNLPRFALEALRSAVYLNGGGTLITDSTSRRSLSFYLFTIACAKLLGCRVLLYGCGIGPVRDDAARKRAAMVLNRFPDAIVLREQRAGTELQRWGVTRPSAAVTADPAVGLRPSGDAAVQTVLRANRVPQDRKLLGVALRYWRGLDIAAPVAAALDRLYASHGFEPVFIPMQPADAPLSAKVSALCAAPCHTIRPGLPAETVLGVLGQMDAVLAMRLHGLIFAASRSVPAVGLAYDVKVSGFTNSLLPCYEGTGLSPLCLKPDTMDANELYAALKTLCDTRLRGDALAQKIAAYLTDNAAKSREILGRYL